MTVAELFFLFFGCLAPLRALQVHMIPVCANNSIRSAGERIEEITDSGLCSNNLNRAAHHLRVCRQLTNVDLALPEKRLEEEMGKLN